MAQDKAVVAQSRDGNGQCHKNIPMWDCLSPALRHKDSKFSTHNESSLVMMDTDIVAYREMRRVL